MTKLKMSTYATVAFPLWKAAHPGKSCPGSISELGRVLRIAGHQIFIMGSMNYVEREIAGLRPDIAIIGASRERRSSSRSPRSPPRCALPCRTRTSSFRSISSGSSAGDAEGLRHRPSSGEIGGHGRTRGDSIRLGAVGGLRVPALRGVERYRVASSDEAEVAALPVPTPGKSTLVEHLLESLGRAQRAEPGEPLAPGRRTLVDDAAAPRLGFEDHRVVGLRDVLRRLEPDPGLRQATIAAAAAADRSVAGRATLWRAPSARPATPAGEAMWWAAERHAATLYRKAVGDGAVDPEAPGVAAALARCGTGEPLPGELRHAMERELGVSLAGVRLHRDAVAAAAARAVSAEAFTVGDDIFFAEHAAGPDTAAGRALLAHELAHVAQALRGAAGPAGAGLHVSQPGDPLEREAEAVAERIAAAPPPDALGWPAAVKRRMEAALGADFSDVRIHRDAQQAVAIGALAYTDGRDVYVAPGEWAPDTARGQELIGHELWHVVQQREGRVRATGERAGTALNDAPELEAEADRMGERAARSDVAGGARRAAPGGGSPAVVQRKIKLGEEALTAAEAAGRVAALHQAKPAVTQGILPSFDAASETFENLAALDARLDRIVALYDVLWDVAKHAASLFDLKRSQTFVQDRLKDDAAGFRGLVTTLGFEHEFAGMYDGPLRGLTHLELARSTTKMPLTGLPWILETDSESTLELVGPPLLVPTVGGRPLPSPEQVEQLDAMIRRSLHAAVNSLQPYNPLGKSGNLLDLIQAISKAGVDLVALPSIHIQRENLTPATQFDVLKSRDVTAELANVQVVPSKKHGGGIDSQVNLATDLTTAAELEALGKPASSSEITLLQNIEQQLARLLSTPPSSSAGVQRFYALLHRTLAGEFAVTAQHVVRTWQQKALDTNLGGKDTDGEGSGSKVNYLADSHSMLSSLVKDVSAIWIKDHLVSMAAGLLTPDERLTVHKDLASKVVEDEETRMHRLVRRGPNDKCEVASVKLPAHKSGGTYQDLNALKFQYAERYNAVLGETIWQLVALLGNQPSELGGSEAASGASFLEHDARFIGARQDTHIDPSRVQLPAIWQQRLHVAEIRKGNIGVIRELAQAVRSGKIARPLSATGQSSLGRQDEGGPSGASDPGLGSAEPAFPESVDREAFDAFLRLLEQIEAEDEPADGSALRSEDANPSNQYVLSEGMDRETKKDETKKDETKKDETKKDETKKDDGKRGAVAGFPGFLIATLDNPGGGDCLFHALAGKTLRAEEIEEVRGHVAHGLEQSQQVHNRNAHQIAAALTQSHIPGAMDMVHGKHAIPDHVYGALQRVRGIYAGEDELSQWCQWKGEGVTVFYSHDSSVMHFGHGGERIPVRDPMSRFQPIVDASICLYKTPNHWLRIVSIRARRDRSITAQV